ncbi:type II toxin-antitoxin system RelE family toxin [Kitasatospora sp. NPDC054939]
MKYTTRFTESARGELRKLSRSTAVLVLRKLAELEQDPYGFHTTALVGLPDHRRLRVGDYRVVYTVDDGRLLVLVVHLGHRSSVYRT